MTDSREWERLTPEGARVGVYRTGAGGVCGTHGAYVGNGCPVCETISREAARFVSSQELLTSVEATNPTALENLLAMVEAFDTVVAENARLQAELDAMGNAAQELADLGDRYEQLEAWKQRLLEKLSDNVGIIRSLDRRVAVAEGRDEEESPDPIRDALEWPGVYKGAKEAALARLDEIEAHVDQLQNALRTVMDNLGVPDEGYPAPVAVAYEAARSALHWQSPR